ncbi:MAG: 16S rRNA (cytosine(1402)-N(4))-methyltransferase RsmH [Actinomycetota bacterium]|nr:16S rRNA (cytosine(1402)-N(4))-methyltransferase RsmH [Actinomycetota bacterium]MDQ3575316.1 16S rRNA (cytosine(1402)-N(4))-methyltransferase RsmH [Actinomycetota bacterium]
MSQAFVHHPVMVDEVVALLSAVPPGVVVDATIGGGGHARALLEATVALRVVGMDRDADAVAAARQSLADYGDRAAVHHARFDRLSELVPGPLSGALFDLGVSSPQLDRAGRGFSYRAEGPLDMRMDRSEGRTAADVVNSEDEATLAGLVAASGERRFARRIARRIVEARPMATTAELAEVVRNAIPAAARRSGGHPARRAFQAIRMVVNDELELLGPALDAAIALLVPGGRCVVLAYHSGEDRIVKERFAVAASGGCTCPPQLPCVCGAVPKVRLLNRGARKPSAAEVAANPRAESARLRACERLAAKGIAP